MVSLWVVGIALVILILVELLWALDIFIAEAFRVIRSRNWQRPLRSGAFWLGMRNLMLVLLFASFVSTIVRDPFRQITVALALLIILMALFAFLAWFFLPRPAKEDAR